MEQSKSIYLFYGEERFLLESEVKKIKKQFGKLINGINFIQLDNNNVENIIQDIETPAFGYNKKLIIVNNSGLFKKSSKTSNSNNKFSSKIAEYIDENIQSINQSILLLFIEDEVEKNELYKMIENVGIIKEFKKLKQYEVEKNIKSICGMYKVNINDQTVKYFIESCGTNMQELINEIRKQIEFVGENGTITKENIDKLAIKQLDSIIFDLTDNLGKKDIKKSLEILSNMIYEKEPIQKILITLYNHFKKLYFTKIAINDNIDVAETLNLKQNQLFLVQKYKMQSKYFSKDEITNILKEMIDLDYKSKLGEIDQLIGLESILCKYCG